MNRPSLAELAARHAAARWPKKKRNADLRRHGYDPDGEHGAIYRDAFHRAWQSGRMADFAGEMAAGADVTCLWDVSEKEWPAWVDAGCGDMPLSEYRERLAIVRRQIESAGGRVVLVRATVAGVLARIAELGMRNDSAGRAAAIGLLGMEK